MASGSATRRGGCSGNKIRDLLLFGRGGPVSHKNKETQSSMDTSWQGKGMCATVRMPGCNEDSSEPSLSIEIPSPVIEEENKC